MKRDTDSLHKFKMLQADLQLRRYMVKGLLQELWDFTAKNCPEGNIGRFPDEEIALAVDWEGDPTTLIAALQRRGWIDAHPEHRLIIHHWPDHCENTVHERLAKELRFFSDGSMPKLTKLGKRDERPPIEAAFKKLIAEREAAKELPPLCTIAREGAQKGAPVLQNAPRHPTARTVHVAEPKTEPGPERRAPEPDLSGAEPGSNAGKAFRQALWRRLQAVVLRGPSDPDDGRDPPEYREWWREVSRQVVGSGGLQVLDEAVTYAENCRDPATRKAKDLGELRKPAAFITGKCNAFVKSLGQSLPAPPKVGEKEVGRAAI